ncbi:MAG TPA: DUF3795 domain-containing protein [bacterium]|nr:DUF3795 domain-containing protein [bacterium]
MSASDLSLLAYCGLYCGACSFKIAFLESERGHLLSMPAKYDKYKSARLENCPGCRANDQDSGCKIRNCAKERKLAHCGDCGDFPCKMVAAFSSDGIPHHSEILANLGAIREIGADAWLVHERDRFTCSCGKRLSWYTRKCIHKR